MKQTVSIVVPSYKSEIFILRAVNSCLMQKNVDVEIIIVEDGVFDKTAELIKTNFISNNRVILFSYEINKGACFARNFGLKHATHDYVMFLDADDFFEDEYFLRSLYEKLYISGADLVFGKTLYKSSKKLIKVFEPPENETPQTVISRMISGRAGPPPCGILWKKSSILKAGAWNEKISKNQDGELIIRAMLKGLKPISYNGKSACIYWQHSGNRVSQNANPKAFSDMKYIEKIILDNNHIYPTSKYIGFINAYRFGVMVRAEYKGFSEIAQEWEKGISGFSLSEFSFSSNKKLLGFWLYKIFGRKVSVMLLKLMRISIV